MRKKKYSEAEYAKVVVDHFESMGYEVFKEVGFGGSSSRADMFCRKAGTTVAVEVKTQINLKVIDQAYGWRDYSSMVYFAVPRRGHRAMRVVYAICESFGIGMLEVDPLLSEVTERIRPTVNEHPKEVPLYEEQMSVAASTAGGEFVTPFKVTSMRLVSLVESDGPMLLSDAVAGISHHYSNDKSAAAGITKMIRWGVIKGLEIYKESNRVHIRKIANLQQ